MLFWGVRMILSYDFVLDMKKMLMSECSVYLHFHDSCAGQYFTLDELNDNVKKAVNRYLDEKNLTAVFTSDGRQFTVTEKK